MRPSSSSIAPVTTPTRGSARSRSTIASSQPGVSTVASPSIAAMTSPPAASSAAFKARITPPCGCSSSVNERNLPESRQRRRICGEASLDSSSTTTTSSSGYAVLRSSRSKNMSSERAFFRFAMITETGGRRPGSTVSPRTP